MGSFRRRGTTPYRFVVHGELEPRRLRSIEASSIEHGEKMTTLVFEVTDSSHLDGIIDRFYDMAVDIASMEAIPGKQVGG